MACCKPCCGCADCTEGQEGKCCCGGSSGTCCQAGEYCCSGVCQPTPCDSGACCLPERCELELVVSFGGTEYEGGPYPTPAGWVQLGAEIPEFPDNISYGHIIPGTEPCDDQSQYYADLVAAVAAWVTELGLPAESTAFSSVTFVAASCADDLSQAYCEESGGVFYAGQTCADDPCPGACCLPGGCLFQSDAIWSGDEPSEIPGYTKTEGGWERLYAGGDCIELNENSQMNQDWFAAVLGIDPGASPISGSWMQISPSCSDSEDQSSCELQEGTYHTGQACADQPCSAGECSGQECFGDEDCPEGCYCYGYDPIYTPEIPGACNLNEFP